MSNQSIYVALVAYAKSHYPGFDVRLKQESRLMRVLGKLLFFAPTFMTQYTTTIGSVVYVPEKAAQDPLYWKVLAHELVHVSDKTRNSSGTVGFGLLYLFPQWLAALGLIGPFFAVLTQDPTWLWGLLLLLLAAPLPAPYRTRLEMRGYAMSIAVNYWRHGSVDIETYMPWLLGTFTGPVYYFMWPFKRSVRKQLLAWQKKIEDGSILEGPGSEPFVAVHEILKRSGATYA